MINPHPPEVAELLVPAPTRTFHIIEVAEYEIVVTEDEDPLVRFTTDPKAGTLTQILSTEVVED